ncbi:MAG: hypothetical protein KA974_11765 [Saprospiraceae bacterium]|nr:hypothetical protein [Saprospiraceae bacterium]
MQNIIKLSNGCVIATEKQMADNKLRKTSAYLIDKRYDTVMYLWKPMDSSYATVCCANRTPDVDKYNDQTEIEVDGERFFIALSPKSTLLIADNIKIVREINAVPKPIVTETFTVLKGGYATLVECDDEVEWKSPIFEEDCTITIAGTRLNGSLINGQIKFSQSIWKQIDNIGDGKWAHAVSTDIGGVYLKLVQPDGGENTVAFFANGYGDCSYYIYGNKNSIFSLTA